MRRRIFLQAASTSLLAAAGRAQTPPPKKAKITSSVMLWTLKGSFEHKLETAARAGIQSVELVGEYSGWTDADIARVNKLLGSFRLGIDLISAVPGWKKMPVSMVDPAQRDNLLREVRKNIGCARKLHAPMLLLISGLAMPGRPRRQQYASLLESSKRCAELAEKAGVKVLLEPLNSKIANPGPFLSTCGEALKLIREVDSPHLRLLFDIYHEQVETGSVLDAIRQAAPYAEVFHVADVPGRHEPGTGTIDYPKVYQAIEETGFEGCIAMEYLPTRDPVASLIASVDQMRAALAAA